MSDQDIFDAEKNKQVVQPDPDADPAKAAADKLLTDQLAAIKNAEGNPKYDSIPKALDALAQSQLHITTLETEAAAVSAELVSLRATVANTDVVKEVMDRIAAQNESQLAQGTPQPNVVDEKAVLALVANALNADKTQARINDNVAIVQEAMVARYGDKAQEEMATKAQALGVTVDRLKELSSQNPSLVLALFGDTSSVHNPTSTSVTLNLTKPAREPLQRPEKSLLMGASAKEQREFMAKIKEDIYAKHDVVT